MWLRSHYWMRTGLLVDLEKRQGSITTQLADLFYSDIGESICGLGSQYRLFVS